MGILLQERADEGIVLLTLNRPDVMNAFNTELGMVMNQVLDELIEDKTVRVLVITGAGRAFSAGGDLKERNGMTPEQWARQHRLFEEVHRKLRVCPKPVIAAVNGYALGGGFEMAISGDFCYASRNARFGFPEVTRGIIPGVGGTQTVGRFAPRGIALELLMTGRHISAEEARDYGFVNRVTQPEELLSAVMETASLIARNSPLAVRMAKKAYRIGIDMPVEEGVEMSLECYNRTIVHPDREEGVRAFNERRAPKFLDIY
ncbi:enoyl-CoA hydratase/isomerase family protein [Sulfobacillus harzensis]|uniref:short-chain-enoyl-CoA hydratase n=1 Tax=Sulfobacillus harzensis TaxID=2729629 RepID=A0A7Y0L745_9FIRM|nr:enoyl-CoA hydratase/isomerase family protein [Sulfobacillus harzensis]NMP23655.1 enoyl-CoA hydratase/isomerase family protein [Sulfobacillus harzensis]